MRSMGEWDKAEGSRDAPPATPFLCLSGYVSLLLRLSLHLFPLGLLSTSRLHHTSQPHPTPVHRGGAMPRVTEGVKLACRPALLRAAGVAAWGLPL